MSEANEVDGVVMCGYFSAVDYCVFVNYRLLPHLHIISCVFDGDGTNVWPIANQFFKQTVMDAITDKST